MDPDPDSDPAIFVIDLQDANKKQIFLTKFFWYIYIIFSKIKCQKEATKQ
jgi:hypothetical protein